MSYTEQSKENSTKLPFLDIPVPKKPSPEKEIKVPGLETMPNEGEYPLVNVPRVISRIIVQYFNAARDDIKVTEPPAQVHADLAVPCHQLARGLSQEPTEVAKELAGLFGHFDFIARARAEKGFLNLELNLDTLGSRILTQIEELKDRYGEINLGNGATVVFDTSSPNIAKHMSVGHLRSTVIGESLARIYQKAGFVAIRDNHLGDWGTQFGMLGAAVAHWGAEMPELQGENPVEGLYKLYVRIHKEVEEGKKGKPKDWEHPLEAEGREWLRRLEEENDPEARRLLEWATQLSLKEFAKIYEKLGSQFEYKLGESFFVPMIPAMISWMLKDGIARVDETGAVKVDFAEGEQGGLGKDMVVIKSNGTTLYSSRDLATLVARTTWFKPARILYVVGGDQERYFKQVFTIFRKMAGEQAPHLEHVSFGMISLPEGAMSTREGRVVFLEDVLNEAIRRAREKINGKGESSLTPDEQEGIAEVVGVGAVIFSDLGQGRERNIKFDWESALSLERNSAPYIQYAHARACSILRKAAELGIEPQEIVSFEHVLERTLVKQLGLFPEATLRAVAKNQPSVIAEYLLTLVGTFNKFYTELSVLGEEDTVRRDTRIRLTKAVAQIIKNGLYLLGIAAPERM